LLSRLLWQQQEWFSGAKVNDVVTVVEFEELVHTDAPETK
jgi:hypothetical protein